MSAKLLAQARYDDLDAQIAALQQYDALLAVVDRQLRPVEERMLGCTDRPLDRATDTITDIRSDIRAEIADLEERQGRCERRFG